MWLLLTALAAGHPLDGTWRLASSPEEAQSVIDAAIHESLVELPWVVRGFARGKIESAIDVCHIYELSVTDDDLFIRCNSDSGFRRGHSGDVPIVSDAGRSATSRVRIEPAAVAFDWVGTKGGRYEVMRSDGRTMAYEGRVSADRLPEPVTWTLAYELVE